MKVERICEAPRVTKPYTEEQWARDRSARPAVDASCGGRRAPDHGRRAHLRLDRRSGRRGMEHRRPRPEQAPARHRVLRPAQASTRRGAWCISARASGIRANNCRAGRSTASGAATASRSGQPDALFADERHPTHYTPEDAKRFTEALTRKLGLATDFIQPGYEDVYYYLWRERRLPVNVDPFESKLDDEMERMRLRRVFTQKLDAVIGYMLPIEPGNATTGAPALAGPGWKTSGPGSCATTACTWCRATRPWATGCRSIQSPGSRKATSRTCLSRIRWRRLARCHAPPRSGGSSSARRHGDIPDFPANGGRTATRRVPFGSAKRAAARPRKRECRCAHGIVTPPGSPAVVADITRTAMCAEPRNGTLYIFMPPTSELEHYLELVAAVEATAEDLDTPGGARRIRAAQGCTPQQLSA